MSAVSQRSTMREHKSMYLVVQTKCNKQSNKCTVHHANLNIFHIATIEVLQDSIQTLNSTSPNTTSTNSRIPLQIRTRRHHTIAQLVVVNDELYSKLDIGTLHIFEFTTVDETCFLLRCLSNAEDVVDVGAEGKELGFL